MKRNKCSTLGLILLTSLSEVNCSSKKNESSNLILETVVMDYYANKLSPNLQNKGIVTLEILELGDTSKLRLSSIASVQEIDKFKPCCLLYFPNDILAVASAGFEKIDPTSKQPEHLIKAVVGKHLEKIPILYNPAVWDLTLVGQKVIFINKIAD